MTRVSIGDHVATRVEQFSAPGGLWSQIFPALTQEIMDRHQGWMVPDYFDPVSGGFITSIHSWLLKTPRRTILIDSCAGDGKRRSLERYNDLHSPFLKNLAAAGCKPEEIDVVLCTHMHVDHVGWNTRLQDGRWVPTFPNAQYLFDRTEYDYWASEETRKTTRASDIAQIHDDSIAPVFEAGLAVFVDGAHEVDDGVVIEPAPGHTAGHAVVRSTSRDRKGLFSGDVMHQPFQIYEPGINSRYCYDPELARTTRRRLLTQCAEEDWLLLPAHFGIPHVGRVRAKGNGFTFHPGIAS
ncbi:MAG TPA: MBL fold metallo-hydrolase [Candidatus Acidoferrales bacterium]|nr:MBL fold metallo-hydrolase [Candidatus Acidoferrales bacterium]